MPNQFPFNEKLTKFPNNQSRDGNDHKYFPTSIYLSLDSSHRKENREEEKIRKERYLRGRGTIFSPVAALSWHFAPKNGTRVRIKVRRSWREKRRGTRREEERTSEYLATTLHAASQLHPRCTCLPSFCSVPLAERLSKKPNHSSHRFSSIVLASTFMHPFHPPFAPQFDSFTVHTATTLFICLRYAFSRFLLYPSCFLSPSIFLPPSTFFGCSDTRSYTINVALWNT